MTIIFNNGYLELSYLDNPYLGGEQGVSAGIQSSMLIEEATPIGLQSSMSILGNDEIIGLQSKQIISPEVPTGLQVDMINNSDIANGFQVDNAIKDFILNGIQALMNIDSVTGQSSQVIQSILDELIPIGSQVVQRIDDLIIDGMEAKHGKLAHYLCGNVYLNRPYLSTSYLAYCIRATQGMQVLQEVTSPTPVGQQVHQTINEAWPCGIQSQQRIFDENRTGIQTVQKILDFTDISMQVEQRIDEVLSLGMQAEGRIFTSDSLSFQSHMIQAVKQSVQVTMVIYNITQLRILMEFASRGTAALGGNNWTSIAPLKTGDFSANNLNTDIVEQRCQTLGTPAIWELRCDTGIPQGAFVDTAAILSHNLSKSARVTMQGSNDPSWSSAGFSVVMVTELDNMYYIAPTLPTDGFRYWRFLIEDSTNPNELAIGAIVFGSSKIMTVRECFQNPVTFGSRHYKDTIETEGFTNVSNDRATRKYMSLNFADLKIDSGNYRMFVDYMKYAKTDLKALIIPRPSRPSALAIFSKLTQLPEETHTAISDIEHYISFTFSWDEGL